MDPWDVYWGLVPLGSTGKKKILILIELSQALFMTINTESPNACPEAGLEISPRECPFLKYESYIDTSRLRQFPMTWLNEKVRNGDGKILGKLPLPIRRKISKLVQEHGMLSEEHQDLVTKAAL